MRGWIADVAHTLKDNYTDRANAALIAAAPDLLDALRVIAVAIGDDHHTTMSAEYVSFDEHTKIEPDCSYCHAVGQAFMVIAKAEGK